MPTLRGVNPAWVRLRIAWYHGTKNNVLCERHHGSKDNVMREAYWLLIGVAIQSCWLPSDHIRRHGHASRRKFDSLCEQYANSLISSMSMLAGAADMEGSCNTVGSPTVPEHYHPRVAFQRASLLARIRMRCECYYYFGCCPSITSLQGAGRRELLFWNHHCDMHLW
jgi:hypothetical protein